MSVNVVLKVGRKEGSKQERKDWEHQSRGGHALFMTLNVNINVENSIKNIYLLISQMFRACYCRTILLFSFFSFLPGDSGTHLCPDVFTAA